MRCRVVVAAKGAKRPFSQLRSVLLPFQRIQITLGRQATGEDALTDRSDRFLAAEIVREKLFRLTGDELPYTSTVVIDKYEEEGGLRRIAASIVVEREPHKAMIIGSGGERLKRIGTEARHELEHLLDARVFLELWVKVRSGWADDEAHLRSYGYD